MTENNPFFQPFRTPRQTYPFSEIKNHHYEEAVLAGIKEEEQEIARIIDNPDAPTFQNTILALQKTGKTIERATNALFNLLSAETSDELQEIAMKVSPLLTEHRNNIALNEKLFRRVAHVYAEKAQLQLTAEEEKLLTDLYENFVLQGVNLPADKKEQLRKISTELSTLTLQFSENLLAENNKFELWLTEEELCGLPASLIDTAREAAQEKGKTGYLITLQAPSYQPFMKYSELRPLREQLYMAYNTQCTHDDAYNNTAIVSRIVNLKREWAQLLGFEDYVQYKLKRRMLSTKEEVFALYDDLIKAYMPAAQKEMEELFGFVRRVEGESFHVQPWDLAYYAEKLRKEKYDYDSELLRPYFELSKVIDGVFGLATRLYGIQFRPNEVYDTYHTDVKTYDIYDEDGTFLAVLYADFHPRAGKRSGAWMTNYKEQWIEDNGENSRPHVSIVMNFSKPTGTKPSLLTFGEVTTFLHEFGHALHQVFANTRFSAMSGTNVYWDFVELPSQFMENFAYEKAFLHTFARHYETGELLPEALIEKVIAAQNFHVAIACIRQIELGTLDMAWYTQKTPFCGDIETFEKDSVRHLKLLPSIPKTCMSVQFSHIMAGGYSAGYYSYKWDEVLDADAFAAFKEAGVFDREVAHSFREHVLSKGGTEHPMTLYLRFRKKAPTIQALLERNGLHKISR
ncbi:MAG: M3 family metallopeptidase [Phocaeicola sp.]|nr:M3 family metallopeptidase [Phocaeicola sp.]MDD7448763.1 M3 family metallopeptidase [Prevotellaceae bacterium]MDY3914340.1 M3 family metallopeptidase [Phocaeicola sp.]MDY5939672.1 M3 family metallopeptidase [Phocaeicola sp.]